jgi:Protein of unknown function (DUF3618)
MDGSGGRADPERVAAIRAEIRATRARIVATLGALRSKADVPARLGDSVGNAASAFAAHLVDRATSAPREGSEDPIADPSASDGSREVGDPAG